MSATLSPKFLLEKLKPGTQPMKFNQEQTDKVKVFLEANPDIKPLNLIQLFFFLLENYGKGSGSSSNGAVKDLTETNNRLGEQCATLLEKANDLDKQLAEAKENVSARDKTILQIVANPFHDLEATEYENTQKWINEVFKPGIAAITGNDNLRFSNRHYMLMMVDYCSNDPVAEVFQIIPDLTAEQKAKIADLQFPRPQIMEYILKEFQTTPNDTTKLVEAPKTETENGPSTTEPGTEATGGKIIPITGAAQPNDTTKTD